MVRLIETDNHVRMTLALVKPYLSQALHYLVEQMTVFVNPKPVKRYLVEADLFSGIKVEKSIVKKFDFLKNFSNPWGGLSDYEILAIDLREGCQSLFGLVLFF